MQRAVERHETDTQEEEVNLSVSQLTEISSHGELGPTHQQVEVNQECK